MSACRLLRQYAPFPAKAAPAGASELGSTPSLPVGANRVTDLSAKSFVGVPQADHLEALRALYAAINPEKVSQVRCSCGWLWLHGCRSFFLGTTPGLRTVLSLAIVVC